MTRREIEALTMALKRARTDHPGAFNDGVDAAAIRVANALSGVNPRFEVARFLSDAGVTSP